MSLTARALAWTEAQAPHDQVARFRRVFALVWLSYDVLDLALGGTASTLNLPVGYRAPLLTLCQVGLIGVQIGMALNRPTAPLFSLLAALLRCFELAVFPLNDFYYHAVICLWLAVPGNPRWRYDLLVVQTAWLYAATGLMKLNADWLSGGHLFVRAGYMWEALDWPHLRALRGCSQSLGCTAWLARGAVLGELALAGLLCIRRGRRLAVALALGIHLFAALTLNVWFFGASMVAQVALLFPTGPARPGRRSS